MLVSQVSTSNYPEFFDLLSQGLSQYSTMIEKVEYLKDSANPQLYPLNVHQFEMPIAALVEDVWKMVQCKASQPNLVVDRIKECSVSQILDGKKHFVREPLIEGMTETMAEDVYIDDETKTVLFIAQKSHFVAINQVLVKGNIVYLVGLYFDGLKEMDREVFDQNVSNMVSKIESVLKSNDIQNLYNKYITQRFSS